MSSPTVPNKEEVDVSIPKPEWKKVEDGHYSEEHVINAYLSGKESALKEISDALSRQKIEYLASGMEYADRLLNKVSEKYGVSFQKVFLRQIEFKHIDVIVVLPESIYFSDTMSDIYETGFLVEEEADELELSFYFTYDLQAIDTNKMTRDGYIFSREP